MSSGMSERIAAERGGKQRRGEGSSGVGGEADTCAVRRLPSGRTKVGPSCRSSKMCCLAGKTRTAIHQQALKGVGGGKGVPAVRTRAQ